MVEKHCVDAVLVIGFRLQGACTSCSALSQMQHVCCNVAKCEHYCSRPHCRLDAPQDGEDDMDEEDGEEEDGYDQEEPEDINEPAQHRPARLVPSLPAPQVRVPPYIVGLFVLKGLTLAPVHLCHVGLWANLMDEICA